MNELEKIVQSYERRKRLNPVLYSYFDEGNLFIIQSRERQVVRIIKKYVGTELNCKRILDVGCGTGGELRNFLKYGARPENLYGIDLLKERIEQAKKINPNINFVCADAQTLPFPDNFFDIVMQFTMFTSILSENMKQNVAREMLRVVRRDGIILWYDFMYDNPKNPDVKGVKKKEIFSLFPNCEFDITKLTLAPFIARKLACVSWLFCYLMEKIQLFNTHYLVVIRKLASHYDESALP